MRKSGCYYEGLHRFFLKNRFNAAKMQSNSKGLTFLLLPPHKLTMQRLDLLKAELVMSSPMTRALQTALIAFANHPVVKE
jgi:hypothetical protein